MNGVRPHWHHWVCTLEFIGSAHVLTVTDVNKNWANSTWYGKSICEGQWLVMSYGAMAVLPLTLLGWSVGTWGGEGEGAHKPRGARRVLSF